MSIHSISLHFLLSINRLSSIKGNYLNIGKQTVTINQKKLSNLGERYGYHFEDSGSIDFSTRKTLASITDDELLKKFSKADYYCLDKSNYETASELVDLNLNSIPERLEANFDFIYDGGTLDNVFNPAQAIKNITKMLRPGGRVLHFNVGSGWPGAFCSFSCEWFFSFYAANNYVDVKTYLVIPVESGDSWPDPAFHIFSYSPFFTRKLDYDPLQATRLSAPLGGFIFCLAERGLDSTNDRVPIQSHYLESGEYDWREKFNEYKLKKDLSFSFSKGMITEIPPPYQSDHYKYLGVLI